MKRFLGLALVALAFVLPMTVATAPPAHAGWHTWETNPCRPDVWWYAEERGVWYFTDPTTGPYLVEYGAFMDTYAHEGYQCGHLGPPVSNQYYTAHLVRQDFESGEYLYVWWA
jgi:hypothetical protein